MSNQAKTLLTASAAAMTAVGMVMSGAPAHARPPVPFAPQCEQYSFDGPFSFRQANGYRIETDLHGEAPAYGTPAVRVAPDGKRLNGNTQNGSVTGRKVYLEFFFNFAAGGLYNGEVDANGFVHGVAQIVVDGRPQGVSWDSETPLVCTKEAPAAPGVATVISDVDIYDQPDGVGTKYEGMFLRVGRKLDLVEPCRDNWCHLVIPEVPGGKGWVYQDGFLQVS